MAFVNEAARYTWYITAIICLIYLFINIIVLCGAYGNVHKDNPVMIIGYVTYIHLVALPLMYVSFKSKCSDSKPWILVVFLILNLCWIIGILIAIVLLSAFMNKRVIEEWGSNPLNHILLVVYFVSAILLEVFAFIIHHALAKKHAAQNALSQSSKEKKELKVSSVASASSSPPPVTSPYQAPSLSPEYHDGFSGGSPSKSDSPVVDASSPPPPPPRAKRYVTSPKRKKRMTKSLNPIPPFPLFPEVPSDPIGSGEDSSPDHFTEDVSPPQPAPRKKRSLKSPPVDADQEAANQAVEDISSNKAKTI